MLRPHEPIWDCFKYAFFGIWQGLKTERNLRIHFGLGVVAAGMGVALGLGALELAVLTLTIALVIILELVNAAFEGMIDLVSPDHHPQAGYVKDVAAGSVLVASVGAVVVGALLFLPRLVRLLAG